MSPLALCLVASCSMPRDDDRGTIVYLTPSAVAEAIPAGRAARWADLRVCAGYPYEDGRRPGAPPRLRPRLEFDRLDPGDEVKARLPWPLCLPIRRGFLLGSTLNCGNYDRSPQMAAEAARDLRLGHPAIGRLRMWSVVFTEREMPTETD